MMTVIPLLDQQPWSKKVDGKTFKFNDGKWVEISPDDFHRVQKTDAQVGFFAVLV